MINLFISLAIGYVAGIATTVILSCMVMSGKCSRKEEENELTNGK